jgi:hypothetical protein
LELGGAVNVPIGQRGRIMYRVVINQTLAS